ncbi:DUF5677 domain-containing protein [Planococcus sp. CAU13]|uniref:DUF5677 domain-containing protein n=1 Tax=Planococcus sp. CAU13 TaxID=1541197 RepID=UPI0005300094|nr:DUF5677 domain-containing protein [Planococcus sp. CAU13]
MNNISSITDYQILTKCITFSESMLSRFGEESNSKIEYAVILPLYRQIIEQSEGIRMLGKNQLESSTKILARGAFETYLAIQYILKDKRRVKDRATMYYIGYLKNQINHIQSEYDLTDDVNVKENKLKDIEIFKEKVMNIKYRKIREEWERTKKELNKNNHKGEIDKEPKWHSLYKGPKSITQLIGKVNNYQTKHLYSYLSIEAHGYEALNSYEQNRKSVDGNKEMEGIHGEYPELMVTLAAVMLSKVTNTIINELYPQYAQEELRFAKESGVMYKNSH